MWKNNMDNEIKANLSAFKEPPLDKRIPLKHLLDQSEEIKADVENAAAQIGSVNAVLKNDDKVLPPFPTIAEVIAQNEEVEKKVVKAAEDLDHVNVELIKQVDERIDIESELRQTQRDLFEVLTDLSKSQTNEKDA
jgi:organic radical activating enzyme